MVEQALLTTLCCVHFTLHSHMQEQSQSALALTHQPAQKMMWLAAQNIKWRAVGKDGQCAQHHKEPLQGAPTGSPLICCCLAALIVAQGCQSYAIWASTGGKRRCSGLNHAWQALCYCACRQGGSRRRSGTSSYNRASKQQSVTQQSQAGLLPSLRDCPAETLQMQTKPFAHGWSGRLWRGRIGSVEVVYKLARVNSLRGKVGG